MTSGAGSRIDSGSLEVTGADGPVAALERHYSVGQIAELWGWSETKVREVFRDEPGVLQSQLRALLRRKKRQNISLRVPESVLLRVHARMSIGD